MNQVMPEGLSNCPPFVIWGACPHALAVDSGSLTNLVFSSFWMEGIKPPSSGGWEYSTSGRQTDVVLPPDMGVLTYPFNSPFLFGLANCDQVWRLIVYSWCSLSASINGPWCHSLCLTYAFLPSPWPHHLTQGLHPLLWMLWWMSMAEVIIFC